VVEPLLPESEQSDEVEPASPTLTEQMLIGTSALTAPFCVVDDGAWPVVNPSADAAWLNRPIALSCAVIGTFTLPMMPAWSSPTDVVEQLLLASAKSPTEIEQALTGTSALATGEVWVPLFVPEAESWPGSSVLPISLANAVMGTEMDTGSDERPPSGSLLVVDVDDGVACAGPLGGGLVACPTAASVAPSTVWTVDCTDVGDVSAPAGANPAIALAPRTTPDTMAPTDAR
jgi:hypothetical protein